MVQFCRSMKGNCVFIREVILAYEVARRQHQLDEIARDDIQLPNEERHFIDNLLKQHHEVFCLSDWKRGETNLVEIEIHTGDATSFKQAAKKVHFWSEERSCCSAKEYAKGRFYQAFEQSIGHSDCFGSEEGRTLLFRIDYRGLNSVTKLDKFPLPMFDDMLDQFGKSKYFSTLDLASGDRQIRIHRNSKEKTAFISRQELYQFKVMPLGLTNAQSVFQRLMQHVLMRLIVTMDLLLLVCILMMW